MRPCRVWFNRSFSSIHAALELIRAGDTACRYHIIGTHTNPQAVALLAADELGEEPPGLDEPAYVEWALAFCRERAVDIFVPGKRARLIAEQREVFAAQGTRVLAAATPDTLRLLHNKAAFYAALDPAIAQVAEFVSVTTPGEFETAYAALRTRHPRVCIKPSTSVYGLGFRIIDETRSGMELLLSGADLHIGLEDLRYALERTPEFRPVLVMEYLDGQEYSVDCIGDGTQLRCAVARKKPLAAGHPQVIEQNPEVLAACEALARTYQLQGNFNVQFREGQNGLRLLEINPRMSGGIGMACLAGPNLPFLALAGFDQGYERLSIPSVEAGVRINEVARPVRLP